MLSKHTHNNLVENGVAVLLTYDCRAFGDRKYKRPGRRYSITRANSPTEEFEEWLIRTVGPIGALWTVDRDKDPLGAVFYFAVKSHAVLTKLTWAGSR
jgi:hypothetical protein